jgi:hypothetical protein
VSGKSLAAGFVIEIVPGPAEARAVVLDVPGRADNAARDGLGAKTVVGDLPDTTYAPRCAVREPRRAAARCQLMIP